jgi:hypothetical protein
MKKKLFFTFIVIILLSTSCVQFRPWFDFNNNQPSDSSFVYSYNYNFEDLINDPKYNKYIVNDVFVFTELTNYPRPFVFGKLYYLDVIFAVYHLSEKEYTSFIIKDIKIISKSGFDYSHKIDSEFPINAFKSTKLGRYNTGKIFKLKHEETILTLTVEINTDFSSETKTLVYKFIPKWRWALIPIFLLPFQ